MGVYITSMSGKRAARDLEKLGATAFLSFFSTLRCTGTYVLILSHACMLREDTHEGLRLPSMRGGVAGKPRHRFMFAGGGDRTRVVRAGVGHARDYITAPAE